VSRGDGLKGLSQKGLVPAEGSGTRGESGF
jgi:hypothetical protein